MRKLKHCENKSFTYTHIAFKEELKFKPTLAQETKVNHCGVLR